VARFLRLWRRNPLAPWPTDPVEFSKFMEKAAAAIDDSIKKGIIKEYGYFLDGMSGYMISEAEATDVLRTSWMYFPYYEWEIHEIIPYEKGKEILRAIMKAQIEAAKK